uniref:Ragulator complex protein LAMTOR3-like n=1 Tax=Hirondellea gigas TaxID=1518452 RepID=A0A2P2I551_9CRUS
MKKFMQNLLDNTPGLLSIVVTDKDGVTIMKVCQRDNHELSQRSSYIALFSSASEQSSKLGLGKNRTIVCFYDKHQVISMNKGVVQLHLIGKPDGNTGDFMTLDQQLETIMPGLTELVNYVSLQTQGEA